MLLPADIVGILKQASDYADTSFSGGFHTPGLPTLADLVQAVRQDRGLTPGEQAQLLSQIRSLVGNASANTDLAALVHKGLGAGLGYLVGKYFGLGMMGRLVSAAAGFGLGRALYNKLNEPPDPYRGYKILG
jgi:hypothetical protein